MKQQVFNKFKRESKWLGIIDYKFLIIIVTYAIILINILKLLPIPFKMQVYIFFFLLSPVFGLILIFTNNDNAFDILKNMAKYYISPKIYVNKGDIRFFKSIIYK